MQIEAFIITRDGQPLAIDLEEDLTSGITLGGDQFPVFTDRDSAEEILRQYYGLHCEEPTGLAVCACTLTIGAVLTDQATALSVLDEEEAGTDLCDVCMTSGVTANRTTWCGKTIGVQCGCDELLTDGTCGDPDCMICTNQATSGD